MSGLLFLGAVGGFVLIAWWAFKNDGMELHESGSGLLAMQLTEASKQKSVPKWKKAGLMEGPRPAQQRKPAAVQPRWQRTLLYGSAR